MYLLLILDGQCKSAFPKEQGQQLPPHLLLHLTSQPTNCIFHFFTTYALSSFAPIALPATFSLPVAPSWEWLSCCLDPLLPLPRCYPGSTICFLMIPVRVLAGCEHSSFAVPHSFLSSQWSSLGSTSPGKRRDAYSWERSELGPRLQLLLRTLSMIFRLHWLPGCAILILLTFFFFLSFMLVFCY